MKTLLFIYNPYAGKGRIRSQLADVVNRFTAAGYLVTAYPTQGRGDATDVAAQVGGNYDRVVCCGGDGTFSEVVAGLPKNRARVVRIGMQDRYSSIVGDQAYLEKYYGLDGASVADRVQTVLEGRA